MEDDCDEKNKYGDRVGNTLNLCMFLTAPQLFQDCATTSITGQVTPRTEAGNTIIKNPESMKM